MAGIDTRTIGVPVLSKGMYGKYPVVMWDAVNTCRGLSCTLGSNCTYFIARGGVTTGYKCDLEVRYLAYVFDTIMAVTQKREMSAEVLHTVGLFIVPLYHHLIKFKKAEYGLRGVVDGLGKVSPIYKEIREIMRTIRGMMADLAEKTGGGLTPGEVEDVVDAAILYGDPDYYDKMSSVAGGDK
jgi:hypothetical protein